MRVFIITISILFISLCSYGQQFNSKNKKAIELYKEASTLDELGNYYESERLLLEALKRDDSFDEAIVLLHQVYLKRNLLSSSESILLQSIEELDTPFINRILVDQAYFLNAEGKYDFARDKLDGIVGAIWNINSRLVESLNNSNQFALDRVKNALEIDFEELPTPLNKFDLQYFPSLTFNNELIFTVRQKERGGDENLYMTRLQGQIWTEPIQISENINSRRNEGTATISGDGRTLVFTACNRPDNIGSCDLYISYNEKEEWTDPELLSEAINSPEWDSQPSLSADGNTLYFTSLRAGGYGKQDIWSSKKVDGVWQEAVNAGSIINSAQDDASPFIYFDNKTLIYATKGRLGMGGFDLFKSERLNNNWSEPLNLGYPINNAFDQVGYSLSIDGWAYFSSSEADGRLLLKRFRVPQDIIKPVSLNLKLIETGIDSLKTREVSIFSKGEYIKTIELNKNYEVSYSEVLAYDTLEFKAKGYQVKRASKSQIAQNMLLEMEPIKVGEVLLEITGNFDFGSTSLSNEFISDLDRLANYLLNNPEIHIEIQGHTDDVGSSEFNYELSVSRAKSVSDYLLTKKIDLDRMTIRGFGETMPKTQDSTKSKLSINRRVEIMVKSVRY